MKGLIINTVLLVLFSQTLFSQDVITVESKRSDISDNLDLEAVASVFGESLNLEDFEKRLNDPDEQISNLDLNGDGYVDYLRVVENSQEQTILITIQAVLGQDLFQDVATIDVERDNSGGTRVQVVGDVYMYGTDYIIEPIYVHTPVVCSYFWGVHYHRYYSPYYWHYYPSYYYVWQPYPASVYRNNVYVHVNKRHKYYYRTARRSTIAVQLNTSTRRNDYGRSRQNKSFASRNSSAKNAHELNRQRETVRNTTSTRASGTNSSNTRTVNSRSNTGTQSTGRKVQSDWNRTSQSNNGQSSQVKNSRFSANRTTTRQTQNKSSNNRSVRSKSSVNRNTHSNSSRSKSVQSKSSSSRPAKAKSSNSSSSNKKSTSRSEGQKSNNKSGNSRSGSSKERTKKR